MSVLGGECLFILLVVYSTLSTCCTKTRPCQPTVMLTLLDLIYNHCFYMNWTDKVYCFFLCPSKVLSEAFCSGVNYSAGHFQLNFAPCSVWCFCSVLKGVFTMPVLLMCPQANWTFWIPDRWTRELQTQNQVHVAHRGTVSYTFTFSLDRGVNTLIWSRLLTKCYLKLFNINYLHYIIYLKHVNRVNK